VVAAGSVHSPALLMRSGLSHDEIGRNLFLHPVIPVTAYYDRLMEPWYGPMMSAYSDQFTRLDGNFGYKLETPPVHAGLMGMVTPWVSGEQYKHDMLKAAYAGTFIVITRDKFGGSIKLDKQKRPRIAYRINPYDRKHLLHGVQQAFRVHAAAGARRIVLMHNDMESIDPRKSDLEEFIQSIPGKSWAPNRYNLFSAHQMGTCRMGGGRLRHPVKPDGETREVRNLYVADASAFPSASGANPMLTIQALAYYIAQGLK
jgi:choline dehydrogenase-like flavoprotein